MIGRINKMLRNKKGFTLVELIVVIAILGILATIAVPRLGGFRDKAQSAADEANIRLVEGAAAMYHADNGVWPDDVDALASYLDLPIDGIPGDTGFTDGKLDLDIEEEAE